MARPRTGETVADARARWAAETPHANGKAPGTKPATEPKRPRSPSRRKPSAKEVQIVCGGLIGMIQQSVMVAAPGLREDELSAQEIGLLSKAVAAEVLASKRLLAYYAKLEGIGGPHGRLGATVLLIALPRLVRHGLMPEAAAAPIFDIVAAVVLADEFGANHPGPGPVPPEAGGARPPDREDGEREVGDGASAAGAPPVPDFLPVEGGRHPLGDGSEDDDFAFVPQRDG